MDIFFTFVDVLGKMVMIAIIAGVLLCLYILIRDTVGDPVKDYLDIRAESKWQDHLDENHGVNPRFGANPTVYDDRPAAYFESQHYRNRQDDVYSTTGHDYLKEDVR